MKNRLRGFPPVALILGVLAIACQFCFGSKSTYIAANTWDANVKTNDRTVTRYAEEAINTRHLLVKKGTAGNQVLIAGAADRAIGTVDNDEVIAGDPVVVFLLGKGETKKVVASGAIAAGADVYQAAGGKVASTGTRWVGKALTAATADTHIIEINDSAPSRNDLITTGKTTKPAATLAVPITHRAVVMATGGAEALTLANGSPGQKLNASLGTDGGDGTLTPTTKTGFSTIVFADVGDIVDLEYIDDTVGWIITGTAGVAAPPVITV